MSCFSQREQLSGSLDYDVERVTLSHFASSIGVDKDVKKTESEP